MVKIILKTSHFPFNTVFQLTTWMLSLDDLGSTTACFNLSTNSKNEKSQSFPSLNFICHWMHESRIVMICSFYYWHLPLPMYYCFQHIREIDFNMYNDNRGGWGYCTWCKCCRACVLTGYAFTFFSSRFWEALQRKMSILIYYHYWKSRQRNIQKWAEETKKVTSGYYSVSDWMLNIVTSDGKIWDEVRKVKWKKWVAWGKSNLKSCLVCFHSFISQDQ